MTTLTTRRLGGALLALALGLLLGAGDARAQAAPETLTLTAAKDSFLRSGSADRNEGANPGLRIQASGNNRVVVGFDPAAIDAFLDANTLTAATLVLTIAANADNWGPNNDRTVDARPLSVDFAEGNGQNAGVPGAQSTRGSGPGVTWNCAADAEIANQATDCDPRWNGGTFGPATAPSVPHVNGLSGAVSWDVTDDVLAGASAWLIKKTAEGQSGEVFYFSKEGSASDGPRLILEGQETAVACPQDCVAGLEAAAQAIAIEIEAGGLDPPDVFCSFDENRQAGSVRALYDDDDGGPEDAEVFVAAGSCVAFMGPTDFVNGSLSDAEQAACAPLAIDILPGVDETNCNISPPPP